MILHTRGFHLFKAPMFIHSHIRAVCSRYQCLGLVLAGCLYTTQWYNTMVTPQGYKLLPSSNSGRSARLKCDITFARAMCWPVLIYGCDIWQKVSFNSLSIRATPLLALFHLPYSLICYCSVLCVSVLLYLSTFYGLLCFSRSLYIYLFNTVILRSTEKKKIKSHHKIIKNGHIMHFSLVLFHLIKKCFPIGRF